MSSQRAAQLIEAGMWLRMTGDLEGARALFERALALEPSNARARQLLQDERIGAGPVVRQKPAPMPPPPVPTPAPSASGSAAVVPPVAPVASSTLIFGGRSAPIPGPAPAAAPGGGSTLVFAGTAGPTVSPPDGAGATMLFPSPSAPVPSPPRAAEGPPTRVMPAPGAPLPPPISSAWDEQIPDVGQAIEVCHKSSGPDAMAMLDAPPSPPAAAPAAKGNQKKTNEQHELDALLSGVKDLIELDDHSGAFDLLVKAEELAPNEPKVREIKERSEDVLISRYESKLGDLQRIPRMRLKQDEIIWLNLDHRAGFVLAQIDGTVSYEDLFAVCGMSRIDTARILAQLVDEGVIA